jgi:uncharacterized protein (DUF885 family)
VHDTELSALGFEFWTWRAAQQPRSHDDIVRIDRPAGWVPDFTAEAIDRYRAEAAAFERRLADLGADLSDPADEVDYRLMRSAIRRVFWELDTLRLWQIHPGFYLDQTLGCVFDLLTPVNVTAEILHDVSRMLAATPDIVATGRQNLDGNAVTEFAELAIGALGDVESKVLDVAAALNRLNPAGWSAADASELEQRAQVAGEALAAYRQHLVDGLPALTDWLPIGREEFQTFLRDIALVPYTPEQLVFIGRHESERAVALELLERRRNGHDNRDSPQPRFTTSAGQSRVQAECELEVRRFYVDKKLLSQPEWLRHYNTFEIPDYLVPIAHLGTADDLTGPQRLDENGSAFFRPPRPGLPYFYAANAHDPRAGIVHEGAHYQQRVMSWRHPRPLRREYYDSSANEGIGFYNEEMLLAAGLFDDNPKSREIIYNFMRLRALRVVVDVQLAVGEMTIDQAAHTLETMVPMDFESARHEAAFFASTPGQAMTYQIGKSQILSLLADAALQQGVDFDLQAFHDRLWLEGNVPISLQRFELLGDRSELHSLDREPQSD